MATFNDEVGTAILLSNLFLVQYRNSVPSELKMCFNMNIEHTAFCLTLFLNMWF